MRTIVLIFFLIFEVKSFLIFSQIESSCNLDEVINSFNIPSKLIKYDISFCKTLPYDSNAIIYFILVDNDDSIEDNCCMLDLYLIKKNKTNNILKYSFFDNLILSDAVSLYEVELDSVIYKIKKDEISLGIRLHYTNNSRIVGINNKELILFKEEKDTFKKIFRDYIYQEVIYGSMDCENVEIYEEKNTIDLIKNIFRKYYTIRKNTIFRYYVLDADCEEKNINIKNTCCKFNFNGIQYYSRKDKDIYNFIDDTRKKLERKN